MTKAERKDLEATEKLSEKGRWGEAIAKLEILRTSGDAEIHDLALNYLADAYEATGRHADAEAVLRQSIDERGSANEGLAWQLAVLAPTVRRQGRNEEAESLYLRAISLFGPDDRELKALTMRNLAYLYSCTGRPEKAREADASVPRGDGGFEAFLRGVMKPYLEPELPA